MKQLWIALLFCTYLQAQSEINPPQEIVQNIQSPKSENSTPYEIDLSKTPLSDVDVRYLAKKLPNLTHLSLAFCKDLTDDALDAIAAHCPHLEKLNIAGCIKITDAGLMRLVSRCTKLKNLDLSSLPRLTDMSLKAIVEHCLDMQAISLWENSISDAGFQFFASKFPGLKEVTLQISPHFQYSSVITEDSIKALPMHCPHLESLSLTMQSSDTWTFLPPLSFPELKHLALQNISDENLAFLASGCPNLQTLLLSRCEDLSDKGLALLDACPSIESVKIDDCEELSSSGLCSFMKKHPLLKAVDLSGNEETDNDVLEALAEHCPNLESLTLLGTNITDDGIISLSPKLKSLKHLDLSQCSQITSVALKALTSSCPLLESLNLAACKKITDTGLKGLIETCPKLKMVDLGACYRLTSSSFQALAACPNLEVAVLALVGSITESDIRILTERCPCLKIIALSPNDWHRFYDSGFVEFLAKAYPNLKIVTF